MCDTHYELLNSNKIKAVFLDRDGTINKDKGYVFRIEDMEILPGVINGLKKLQKLGYKLIVITGQSGIARGFYTLQDAEKFDLELARRLKESGIVIEKFYRCPHHPDITGDCDCRKPKTGLVLEAAREFDIDLAESFFVGDKDSDILLGQNCGGATFWIRNNQYSLSDSTKPDYQVSGLDEVASIAEKLKK